MVPKTRSTTKKTTNAEVDVIYISDSGPEDSTSTIAGPASKRRRLQTSRGNLSAQPAVNGITGSVDVEMDLRSDDSPHSEQNDFAGGSYPYPSSSSSSARGGAMKFTKTKNATLHLKGRKRFSADFTEMGEESKNGFEIDGLSIRDFRAGDDEGSIEFKILTEDLQHIASVNLLVSDTSEYPDHHTYFSFSPDPDLPSNVLQVIENVSSGRSRPIKEAIGKLLSDLCKAVATSSQAIQESQETDEDEDEDYDAYDDDDDQFGGTAMPGYTAKQISRLKHDFIETVAAGYRPGHISFGTDDFALSVSLPVIILASFIPPRALMAWDRRLLSRTQHLTLLISGLRGTYPPVQADGSSSPEALRRGVALQFRVGLTRRYKPGKDEAAEASRTFGMIIPDAEDELLKAEVKNAKLVPDEVYEQPDVEENEDDTGRFDRFSLSSSLESLLDQALLRIIQLRRKFGLGWAGAEALLAEVEKSQKLPGDILASENWEFVEADKAESKLARTYNLPVDPLVENTNDINLPLTAFCYLLRRLTLCNRYCLVCHNPINKDFEALKPYVCDSKLCAYQYYSLNRGPSLEYEILHNSATVDLLLSLAYSAAAEQVLDEPLPLGMGLRVNIPDPKAVPANAYGMSSVVMEGAKELHPGADGLCDIDDLNIWQMRAAVASLIDSLPSVEDMKRHLERKVKAGKSKPKLKDMDPTVLPAAWSILRWCVASCTAHLEETSKEERVRNIDNGWKQFRFSVGAPDAEAKFKDAITLAQESDKNAQKYPSLYAFHGSALKNWHSIIRHGLWFKTIVNGRAFGNGVYLAKDGAISMGGYAATSTTVWRNSKIIPTNCVALAEIVNLPQQFVSHNPYFVVKDTHWIMCRYLLVKGTETIEEAVASKKTATKIPLVKLDPAHPITLSGRQANNHIEIPQPSYQLETLLADRKSEYSEEDPDDDDVAIFEANESQSHAQTQTQHKVVEVIDKRREPQRANNDWKHDEKWVKDSIEHLMPPPLESTPSATMAVQRELRSMLKEQEAAKSLAELGWYMPPELIGDNLFQWIVEMHSFDKELPIANDMKSKHVNSIIFEIRFPPSFPIAPPFFRIITPRFLPFIQGGGGHVTGGGSICMDLLTADGWLPSYSISAILLQIKLAISNLEPRPARFARNWATPYNVHEALEGYKRAATAHGWKIPPGTDKLVR